MSKKKKAKKRSFKASAPPRVSTAARTPMAVKPAALASTPTAAPVAVAESLQSLDPRWGYVGRDLRRTISLGIICILLELGLALLFSHTGLGDAVYHLIKL
jgi:hypothetical protein